MLISLTVVVISQCGVLLLFSRYVISDSLGTPWTVPHQAPLSLGFSRQEYWNGLSFSSPGDLPCPGIKSPTLTGGFFTTEPWWIPHNVYIYQINMHTLKIYILFFKNFDFYLLIIIMTYCWLCWIFMAEWGYSLVAVGSFSCCGAQTLELQWG